MAENSPARRSRVQSSPQYHPYDRQGQGKSPLQESNGKNSSNILQENPKKSPRKVKALPIALAKQENDFFSFSGGSLSLFPSAKVKEEPNYAHDQPRSQRLAMTDLPVNVIKRGSHNAGLTIKEENVGPSVGIIGGNRRSASTIGFIPVDKSCTISGNDASASINPISFQSNRIMGQAQGSVTTGVLGQLQPKGLNTSFTEKFVSHLGLYSRIPPVDHDRPRRGILTERFTPLFDFPEYTNEIVRYWLKNEKLYLPKSDYMEKQTELSHKMRSILVDWLVEVVMEYEMTEETLHLTINYLDRFLSRFHVVRKKLQLIGTTALFIASKFEEINPPEVNDYVYVTDEAYDKRQILNMEKVMLQVLKFDLVIPTASGFTNAFCSVLQLNAPARCLAMYLVDLSLLEGEKYLIYLPSVIAAAAVALGRFAMMKIYWDDNIKRLVRHREKTVSKCVQQLHNSFFEASNSPQTTIYEKYTSVRYCSISKALIPAFGPWNDKY